MAKLLAMMWLSHALSSSFKKCGGQVHKVHETTTFLLVTLQNILLVKIFFH